VVESNKNIEIAVIKRGEQVRYLPDDEVDALVAEIEKAKAEEAEAAQRK